MDKPLILIVDDEEDFCQTVSDILEHSGFRTVVKQNPVEALELLQVQSVDLVLLDILMPQMDGRQVLTEIVQSHPEIPVIMITGQAYNVPVAIETAKKGSFSFLAKPIDLVQLKESVKMALDSKRPKVISNSIEEVMREVGIVSASKSIEQIMGMAEKVAKTTVSVLVTGESGVGKEVLAKSIHKLSNRREKPFVSVDCGTLTETLLESELFGHVKGSFTGAHADKKGLFEIADGGTIFLDEIGNLPFSLQAKLLTALQSRSVTPVGSTKPVKVDVRLICATNRDLHEMSQSGDFREDLLYRINTVEIVVPPLRNRKKDIAMLARYFLQRYARKYGKDNLKFDKDALLLLREYHWPGNVRELQHAVERAVIMADDALLTIDDFGWMQQKKKSEEKEQGTLKVDRMEREIIEAAIRKNHGNLNKAADELGIGRSTLYRKIKKYGI